MIHTHRSLFSFITFKCNTVSCQTWFHLFWLSVLILPSRLTNMRIPLELILSCNPLWQIVCIRIKLKLCCWSETKSIQEQFKLNLLGQSLHRERDRLCKLKALLDLFYPQVIHPLCKSHCQTMVGPQAQIIFCSQILMYSSQIQWQTCTNLNYKSVYSCTAGTNSI